MNPGKDEVVLTRLFNRSTGVENLVLIFHTDLTETEALSLVGEGFDLDLYERDSSMTRSHWLDRPGGDLGITQVVFRKII